MLVRQMLAYAGKGKFVIERVDLAELVRSTRNLVVASIPKAVHLNVQTKRDTPPNEADSSQIQQIIMNLIINAAEAIGEEDSGIVTVRTGLEILDREDPIDQIGPGSYAVLEVVDTGCGMNEDTQARIFEPFFTTKFTGRGLGLAAVTGIVRAAKGTIRVRSAIGHGTTFRVLLPAKMSSADLVAVINPPTRGSTAGTILVVDDEEIVRRAACAALDRGGYTVHTATGGKDAIAQVLEAPTIFDLVLLDMNMPGLSGEETLRQLRAINAALPIAVFSGYSVQEVAGRLGTERVAGILPKPFTSRPLLDRISGFLSIPPAHA
jgi:CheY-like chemotaxis protein